jgi:hypothetical protein
MRSDISTVVLNDLQAEFGTAPASEENEAKCSTAAFPKLFMFREVGSQVSLVTMSCPSLRTVAPPPCLPLDIKDLLKEDTGDFGMGDFDWVLLTLLLAAVCLHQSSLLHGELYT